jgi:YjbE family integral membrane protein
MQVIGSDGGYMELFSTEFFSALAAIIIIDLVLAGDNAIVIALAARNLPANLRKQAIVWGTVGAIAVRTVMTLIVVWLLKVPGLLAVGGVLLIWIAYKLIIDNEGDDTHKLKPSTSFWAAMNTIIVADALMGLDNVLAVAGAAQGSFLLVVVGLLISIPIVVWGSQLILKFVVRYPVIVYVGSAVLAWTAVKMVTSEPLLEPLIHDYPVLTHLSYALVIGGVLVTGFLRNHRQVRKLIAAHLVHVRPTSVAAPAAAATNRGKTAMIKILLPVDGSANSLKAARHVVNRFLENRNMEVQLLHVRQPLSQHIARWVSARDRAAFHREAGEEALAPARELLGRFGVPHVCHVELGQRADTITRVANRLGVSEIVMGTARKNSLTRLLEDSVTLRVIETAQMPVEVVPGEAVSKIERFGVPAGAAGLIALLFAAAD